MCKYIILFHVVSTINPHSVHCLRFVLSVPVGLLSCERDSSRWMEVSSVCAKSNTLSVPLHLCLSYATPLLFLLQLLPVTHHSGKHMQPSWWQAAHSVQSIKAEESPFASVPTSFIDGQKLVSKDYVNFTVSPTYYSTWVRLSLVFFCAVFLMTDYLCNAWHSDPEFQEPVHLCWKKYPRTQTCSGFEESSDRSTIRLARGVNFH